MSNQKISTKKLKAIVFTDIVDFTKISADDEHHALELINKHREILKPIVEKHNGEWLKESGDGLLLSFDSTLEAVRCSIEIQETLKDIDKLNIRIGIHQGDIFIMDGDVFGDDVNIASRIESFSPSGGISLSDKVHKDISGVSDIKTSFIGHRKLKGVGQETKVRCITSHNLPQHNLSKWPIRAAYICFFWAALSFTATIIYPIAKLIQTSLHPEGPLFNYVQVARLMILTSVAGLTHLLIGYSTLSFSRGLSISSQRLLVYLTYIYGMLPVILFILNANQQAVFKQIVEHGIAMILAFFVILVVFPTIGVFLFRRIFNDKTN